MNKPFFLGLVYFIASLFLFFCLMHFGLPPAQPRLKSSDFQRDEPKLLHYTALGDSLTEGVGDSSEQGGFVPLLAQSIQTTSGYQVAVDNFGVAGNTSKQILTRMQEDDGLQKSLAQADFMTLTVGGNDVMAVIRKDLANLQLSSFKEPLDNYSKNLIKIIEKAREDNPNLPIYILGIYNPFYLNFPDLTAMQVVVDDWNQRTEETAEQYQYVYFIPINDLLYKGINGQEGVVESNGSQTRVTNDALFEGDSFHPNNVGYQIMQAAVMEKMNESKQVWQKD